eukprot:SM006460S20392  [mRNA]  locus=s6460:4:792:- [translate_table: standard]
MELPPPPPQELFGEIGELKRCEVHYDRSGRSKGLADVVYARKADALAAISRYNSVPLDGKAMTIKMVQTMSRLPADSTPALQPMLVPVYPQGRSRGSAGGAGSGRNRGGGGGSGGGGGGGG